jgi:sugar phosphate isomerase/epimerase
MKLASADFTWPGLRTPFIFDLIRELELDGVAMAFYGGLTERTPQQVAEDPEAWGERVAGELGERGLEAADAFFVPQAEPFGMAVNDPDPREREAVLELFERFCRFVRGAGADGVTVLPGLVFGGEAWADAAQRAADGLKRQQEAAERQGLRLSVEPHIVSTHPYSGSLIDTPEKVAGLIELVPGLELSLDYGHFNVQGIPDREVEPLLAHARLVHMRGGAPGLVQTKFDDNVTDFGRILDVLQASGYDGWVDIEYVHDERPGCSDCDAIQEIMKFRDFVRDHLAGITM